MADEKVRTSVKVEFSLQRYQKELADVYAEVKGFKTTSALARYALLTHMVKTPLSRAQRVQVEKNYGKEIADALAPAQQPQEGE